MNLDWLAPTITAAAAAFISVSTYMQNRKILKKQEEARLLAIQAKTTTDSHTEQLCEIKQAVTENKASSQS